MSGRGLRLASGRSSIAFRRLSRIRLRRSYSKSLLMMLGTQQTGGASAKKPMPGGAKDKGLFTKNEHRTVPTASACADHLTIESEAPRSDPASGASAKFQLGSGGDRN